MTKLRAVIIMFALLLMPAVLAINIKADPPIPIPEGWVDAFYCDESNGLTPFYKASSKLMPASDEKNIDRFVRDENLDGYCINENLVGSLSDYVVGGNSFELKNASTTTMGFCGRKDTTSQMMVMGFDAEKDEVEFNGACCPPNARYNAYVQGNRMCCPEPFLAKDVAFGAKECPNTTGTEMVESTIVMISALGTAYFPNAEKAFVCPVDACLVKGTKVLPKAEQNKIIRASEKSQYQCKISRDDAINLPNSQICYKGQAYDWNKFQEYRDQMTILDTCGAYPDEARENACFRCYEPCKGATACTIAYSEAGCFDTTPAALITRVFQIGVGIVGGVGMVRIMQGAILRQSGDPSKIQESYEIISSVIIGFVLLLGAVALLQFIGIRVLGILPFDAFQ